MLQRIARTCVVLALSLSVGQWAARPAQGDKPPQGAVSHAPRAAAVTAARRALLALCKPVADAAARGLRGRLRRAALKASGKKAGRGPDLSQQRTATAGIRLRGLAGRGPQSDDRSQPLAIDPVLVRGV